MKTLAFTALAVGLVVAACGRREPEPGSPASVEAQGPRVDDTPSATAAAVAASTERDESATPEAPGDAKVGQAAPNFSLSDLDGKPVKLGDFAGKIVVLEWFNPECPFVRLAHTKGSLVGLADKYVAEGVVWLGINSGAPGRQGHGAAVTLAGQRRYQMKHPILLDETGDVGARYGAERTPELYVIDAEGVLRYRGAVDNSPDAEGEAAAGGVLVNYGDAVLSALIAGKPSPYAQTEPYGCTVKYAAESGH